MHEGKERQGTRKKAMKKIEEEPHSNVPSFPSPHTKCISTPSSGTRQLHRGVKLRLHIQVRDRLQRGLALQPHFRLRRVCQSTSAQHPERTPGGGALNACGDDDLHRRSARGSVQKRARGIIVSSMRTRRAGPAG